MGGNALKNVNTVRKDKKEFLIIEKEVTSILNNFFPQANINSLTYYRQKENFGDLDIIISEESYINFVNTFWEQYCKKNIQVNKDEEFPIKSSIASEALVKNLFNSKECYHSYPQFSFDYTQKEQEDAFQVDIILTPNLNFNFSKNYLSYNDLGNFIGVIASNMGFKFGNAGLNYHLTVNGNFLDIINITLDYNEALQFLGFNKEQYNKGFNTLNEIFDFVKSSQYFDPKIYKLSSRNSKQRARDRKRVNYGLFLNNIKDIPENKYTDFINNNDYWLNKACLYFPDLQKKINDRLEQENNRKLIKKLFNGKIVSEITGLLEESKELGVFMDFLREQEPDNFQDFILNSNSEQIRKWILIHFKNNNSLIELKPTLF